MKKILGNWRNWVLALTAAATIVCLAAEPHDNDPNWLGTMLLTKALAALFACVTYLMFTYWKEGGKLEDLMKLTDID